jgi:lysophospholipase L1-like esterase
MGERTNVGVAALAMDAFIAQFPEDILDLRCDPDFYSESTLSPDLLHLNDAGYAHMAQKIADIVRSPRSVRAASSCSPYSNPI